MKMRNVRMKFEGVPEENATNSCEERSSVREKDSMGNLILTYCSSEGRAR